MCIIERRHDDRILKLPWGEGCGWYDVNKTYWKDDAEDGYMCWAGASSNILHWWIDRNKEYVAAYDARYGMSRSSKSIRVLRPTFLPHRRVRYFGSSSTRFRTAGPERG